MAQRGLSLTSTRSIMTKLLMDTISRQGSIRAVRERLQSLPEDLDSVYGELISLIPSRGKHAPRTC